MNSVTFGEQPSDKEELDAVLNRDQTEHGVEYVAAEAYRQLETENAELKAKVEELKRDLDRVFPERDELKAENIRITKLRDHDFEELAELAELKRKIAEGKLIPLEVYIWWTEEEGMNIPVIGGMSLQEFAKREAAQ